jgi:hypothetical protein
MLISSRLLAAAGLVGVCLVAPQAHATSYQYNKFMTPSGNIGCYIDASGARCDIAEASFAPPPRPGACQGSYGRAVKISHTLPAQFICVSDFSSGSDWPVLQYGDDTSSNGFTCSSGQDGVTCKETSSGKGFRLAKEGAEFF